MNEPTETPIAEISEIESLHAKQPAVDLAATAGTLLKQARERAGVHLGMLAVALKVPVSHLTALESDAHAQLPGPVFVRGLAASVCRQLKVDAAPVLALLPLAPQRLQAMPSSLEPGRPEFWGRSSNRRLTMSRQFVLLALLMLALIALVSWLPEWPTSAALVAEPVPQVVASDPATPLAPMVVLLPSDAIVESLPGTLKPVVQPGTAGTALPVPASSAPLELVFKGKADEAWVEVQDRTGTVVFSKLVKSGETHVVKGVPVLTVVVGFADAIDVVVRGQTLDLTPFSRGAVARFEVK